MNVNEGAMSTKRTIHADEKLCRDVGQSEPGARIIYHRGFLPADASPPGGGGCASREVQRVARRARQLAADGAVHLVQRRNADGDYIYIAIVRARGRHASDARLSSSAATAPKPSVSCREIG